MNEVFEKLSDIFEELRSEADEREYSIQTEEAQRANNDLKKKNEAFEKYLFTISPKDRIFLQEYMETVDHAHFQEEQIAYYQGMIDAIQVLAGLGIVEERKKVKELLKKLRV